MSLLCAIILLSSKTKAQHIDSLRIYHWSQVATLPTDSVTAISFRKLKLRELPPDLAKYTRLRYLDLGQNKLKSLPDYLQNMQHLQVLDLNRNELAAFPPVLLNLPALEKLILNRNSISALPEDIHRMKALRVLDLWDNPLPSLPDSLAAMSHLKELHLEGIMYGPTFQENWRKTLTGVRIYFDQPCDCRE